MYIRMCKVKDNTCPYFIQTVKIKFFGCHNIQHTRAPLYKIIFILRLGLSCFPLFHVTTAYLINLIMYCYYLIYTNNER